MLSQVTPGAFPSTRLPNGTSVAWLGGPSGEGVVSQLHGKWYQASLAKNVFQLQTATAGTTIPVQATNLVSTFTLLNPIGSGKVVELISYTLGILNATTVVSDVSLYWQPNIGNGQVALGTLTALTIRNAYLDAAASSSVCTGYSAATFTNTMGTNMFLGPTLTTFGAVTTNNARPIVYEFNGSILVPPGTAITTAGNAAQTQAMRQGLIWAEWPL